MEMSNSSDVCLLLAHCEFPSQELERKTRNHANAAETQIRHLHAGPSAPHEHDRQQTQQLPLCADCPTGR